MQPNNPSFNHPCFQNTAAKLARMHLPVAKNCNIKCSFCNPNSGDSCIHGCIPGLTREVLSPSEALERLRQVREDQGIKIKIVGIAGPGEPLFNEETFQTMALIREHYPEIHLCLSTNGLLLPKNVDRIASIGVETLTVTVNCLSVSVARTIYDHVMWRRDDTAFEMLMENQRIGIGMAAEKGLCIKVNSVLIAGENEAELPEIARKAKEWGAYIHNVLPLIPRADTKKRHAPDKAIIERIRSQCGEYLCQFEKCRHCRADAIVDADE